jgi:hypothetical protein
VSGAASGDFENDLLAAKERDLAPLLRESSTSLDFDATQASEMSAFLSEAWFLGANAGHSQVMTRALQREADVDRAGVEKVEAEFKALMERSADALELPADETISMWSVLGKAWIAGAHACETEALANFLKEDSGIAEEALRWLEDK